MEMIHYLNCADKKIKLFIKPLQRKKAIFTIIQNNSSVMRWSYSFHNKSGVPDTWATDWYQFVGCWEPGCGSGR